MPIHNKVKGVIGTHWVGNLDAMMLTAVPDLDDDFVNDLTEASGGNYARVDVTGASIVIDNTNDEYELHSDDVVFPSIAAAAGEIDALEFILQVTNDADSIPLLWNLPSGGSFTPDGNNVEWTQPADGWGKITEPA